MTTPSATSPRPKGDRPSIRTAIAWGVVVGLFQAASPLAFWWVPIPAERVVGDSLLLSARGQPVRMISGHKRASDLLCVLSP